MESIKKDKIECEQADLRSFARDLDEKIKAEGKLNDFLLVNKNLHKKKSCLGFDVIL